MRKAKTVLEDEYLDIVSARDNMYLFFKCLCHHSLTRVNNSGLTLSCPTSTFVDFTMFNARRFYSSMENPLGRKGFKKMRPPHKLPVALCLASGAVRYASCACVARFVGFCNHVLALKMKLCKFSLYSCQDTKELDHESDKTPPKACTSSLQLWHRPVGGDKIKPQPVMELEVKRCSLDEEYNLDIGVRNLLYEARKNLRTQTSDEVMLKDKLQKNNSKFALSQIMSPGGTTLQETKLRKSPSCSYAMN